METLAIQAVELVPALLEDQRFASSRDRRANESELTAEISAWTRRHTKREAMQILADQLIDNIEAFAAGNPQNVVE